MGTEWYGDALKKTPTYPSGSFRTQYYLKVYKSPNGMRLVTELRVRFVNPEGQIAQCLTVNGEKLPQGDNPNKAVLEEADFNIDELGLMQIDAPPLIRFPEDYPSRIIIPRTTNDQPNVYSVLLTNSMGAMNLGKSKETLRSTMRRIRRDK